MKQAPSFKVDHISQIPVLQLLINPGYEYLTFSEALDARGGRASNVILHIILDKKLRDRNKITFRDGVNGFSNSNINAAVEAIKAPSHCIEYVVMHELCHLKYADHDNQFYNFLASVMPDWKDRKLRLEKAFL